MDRDEESIAVSNFRNYLRIPSMQPNVNYDECVAFLSKLAEDLNLPAKVIDIGNPVVIITIEGKNTKLPSIFLNSHMDVVPVVPEKWTHPPFAAEKDTNGNIYARGAQDMKCVGIQYIEAMRRHLKENRRFERTIHVAFVPDEEIGGHLGMAKLTRLDDFKQLNVGFALDEGLATQSDEFWVFYAQRSSWKVKVLCPGQAGHGSLLPDHTAGEKLQCIINKFFRHRTEQKHRLMTDTTLTIGDVTSINLTMISGGEQSNVLPSEIAVTFDVRIDVDMDHIAFENEIGQWCAEAGPGVRYEFLVKDPKWNITKLDNDNPWWMAFKTECNRMKLNLKPAVCPASGDSRFLRQAGIPTLGFSPMNLTPMLLHDHDEYLNENVFLRGIDIYYNIIKEIASI